MQRSLAEKKFKAKMGLVSISCEIVLHTALRAENLTLYVDNSPRVLPKTKRGIIEKNENEQRAGTVHEMQQ